MHSVKAAQSGLNESELHSDARIHERTHHHVTILNLYIVNSQETQHNVHYNIVFSLEKVLLDPIFMILKCEYFTHFGSFCETSRRFDLSSRSLGHVLFSAGTALYIKRNSPSMNREQGYQLPPIYHQLLLPEQFPRKNHVTKASR